jgi:hypothetical protein
VFFLFSIEKQCYYWFMDKKSIPPFVSHVTETLQKAGFEAYLVGGCAGIMHDPAL